MLANDELLQLAQVLADQTLRFLHAVGTAVELDQLGELQIHLLHLAEIVALQHENLQQRRYSSPFSLASTRQIPLRRLLERVLPHIDAIQVRHARHAQHFALREAVLPQSQRLALAAAAHLQNGAHGTRAVLDLHVLRVAAHDLQLLHVLERVLGDRQRAAAGQICEEAPRRKKNTGKHEGLHARSVVLVQFNGADLALYGPQRGKSALSNTSSCTFSGIAVKESTSKSWP